MPARLAGTLIGVYLPLIVALIPYHSLEPGNLFFFISMLACILGFHLPGWVGRRWTVIVISKQPTAPTMARNRSNGCVVGGIGLGACMDDYFSLNRQCPEILLMPCGAFDYKRSNAR